MKGQLPCFNCRYGIHVEAEPEGEDIFCPNCGKTTENVTQDDLIR